ncbi:hypothetical protein AGR7B_Cc10169 [Agrobacterium deltaense RV3]|nr:hypothetical protein AGR7B_Cc10169 [Agrobacterium deltaense RV3]
MGGQKRAAEKDFRYLSQPSPYAEPPPPDLCVCFHFSISDFALLHEINQLRRKGIEKQRIAP